MNYLDWSKINSLAVKQAGKCAVYISNGLECDESDKHIWDFVMDEFNKLYDRNDAFFYICNTLHGGLFLFDTEEEQERFYKIFEQELTDSSAIYACTYDKYGNCLTENT